MELALYIIGIIILLHGMKLSIFSKKKQSSSLSKEEKFLLVKRALEIMDEKFHDRYSDSKTGNEWIEHCNSDQRQYLKKKEDDYFISICTNE